MCGKEMREMITHLYIVYEIDKKVDIIYHGMYSLQVWFEISR